MFKNKSEIHSALMSTFSGYKMDQVDEYGYFGEAFRSMTKTMVEADDSIEASELADKLVSDLVVMESYIKREGHRQVKNGKFFLPREKERVFAQAKEKDLGALIERLAETANQAAAQ